MTPLPGGNLHHQDGTLYFAEIRADALRRGNTFVKGTR